MKPVSDPTLLQQLEGQFASGTELGLKPVSDPSLLQQLDAADATPEAEPSMLQSAMSTAGNAVRGVAAVPLAVGQVAADKGGQLVGAVEHTTPDPSGAIQDLSQQQKSNPFFNFNPMVVIGPLLKAYGIEGDALGPIKTLVEGIQAAIEANQRGMAGAYPPGEEGERQRARDALAVSTFGLGPAPAAAVAKPAAVAAPAAASAGPPTAVDTMLQGAARQGLAVPSAMATDSYAKRAIGATLQDTPAIGEPLVRAADAVTEGAAARVTGLAEDLGSGNLFASGQAVKDDLLKWIEKTQHDEAAAIWAPVKKNLGNKLGRLTNTANEISDIVARSANAGRPAPKIVDDIARAVNDAELRGGMNFQGMQDLRSDLGAMLSGDIVPEGGLNMPAVKKLYKAITSDIEKLATSRGKKTAEAWRKANETWRVEIGERREALTKIVGLEGDATPAAIIDTLTKMSSAKRGADLATLDQVKKTIGKQAWDELAGRIVAKIAGAEAKDGWSFANFRTGWSQISDEAKSRLFSLQHRQALDDIAEIGKYYEKYEKLSNRSRSGVMGTMAGVAAGIVTSPIKVLAGAAGARTVAQMLARPATARSISLYARAYRVAHRNDFKGAPMAVLMRSMRSLRKAAKDDGLTIPALSRGILAEAADADQAEKD